MPRVASARGAGAEGICVPGCDPRPRPQVSKYGRLVAAFAADPVVVKKARDRAGNALATWRIPQAIDDTLYVVSELMTNAVSHTAGLRVELVLTYGDGLLLVDVRDESTRPPALVRDPGDGEGGRGLQLVHALSIDSGWVPLGQGRKSVWALLAVRRAEFAAVRV